MLALTAKNVENTVQIVVRIHRAILIPSCKTKYVIYQIYVNQYDKMQKTVRHGHDWVLFGFIATYAISVYHY